MKELPTPESVNSASNVVELARIWIADGSQVFTITPNLWKDSAAWGLLLCDLARQVAKAYEAQGQSSAVVLERIKQAFEVEWKNPTHE
jgi:hypothetical protein